MPFIGENFIGKRIESSDVQPATLEDNIEFAVGNLEKALEYLKVGNSAKAEEFVTRALDILEGKR